MKEIRRIVHEAACNYYQNNKDEMVTMEEAWAGATDITEADIPEKKGVCNLAGGSLLSKPDIFKDRERAQAASLQKLDV